MTEVGRVSLGVITGTVPNDCTRAAAAASRGRQSGRIGLIRSRACRTALSDIPQLAHQGSCTYGCMAMHGILGRYHDSRHHAARVLVLAAESLGEATAMREIRLGSGRE